MNFKKSLIIALLSLGVVNTAVAGSEEDLYGPANGDAIYDYDLGHYKEAFSKFQKIVKEKPEGEDLGIAYAYLGFMYEEGKGVKQDFKKAFSSYQKVIGEREVIYRLGVMYLEGKGVKKDKVKAKQYFEEGCNSYYEYKSCDALKSLTK